MVSRMITATAMFADSSTSISAAGSGTRITSTLAMIATGSTRSWPRLSQPAPAPGSAGALPAQSQPNETPQRLPNRSRAEGRGSRASSKPLALDSRPWTLDRKDLAKRHRKGRRDACRRGQMSGRKGSEAAKYCPDRRTATANARKHRQRSGRARLRPSQLLAWPMVPAMAATPLRRLNRFIMSRRDRRTRRLCTAVGDCRQPSQLCHRVPIRLDSRKMAVPIHLHSSISPLLRHRIVRLNGS